MLGPRGHLNGWPKGGEKLHAHAKAVKAGLISEGEHETIPATSPELQIAADLHEEHNLPAGTW